MQITLACSCLLILVIQPSILLPRMKMKKHPLEWIYVQNAVPPGSHSYVLLNKAIVVSTDDGTALIVDSLVEKAFLRQVFLPVSTFQAVLLVLFFAIRHHARSFCKR